MPDKLENWLPAWFSANHTNSVMTWIAAAEKHTPNTRFRRRLIRGNKLDAGPPLAVPLRERRQIAGTELGCCRVRLPAVAPLISTVLSVPSFSLHQVRQA